MSLNNKSLPVAKYNFVTELVCNFVPLKWKFNFICE